MWFEYKGLKYDLNKILKMVYKDFNLIPNFFNKKCLN
jgi:hypothetical protein